MLDGLRRYAAFVAADQTAPAYIMLAATFFGKHRRFLDDFTPSRKANGNGVPPTDRATRLRKLGLYVPERVG